MEIIKILPEVDIFIGYPILVTDIDFETGNG